MRNSNNNKTKGKKSNKNMSNKDMYKALKERDKAESSSYNKHDEATGSEKFNDPDWYINSEQILKDAASIPYSIPVGTCVTRDGRIPVPGMVTLPAYDNALPGIMVSYLMPTLGSTDQGSSAAVNVAANSLFQYVRKNISGSRRYETVDLMLYMGAMDSLFCMITWLTRLYATVYTYHQANKYLSRAIIEAQNVDYDDLVANLQQFRTQVNVELAKVRALYLPSVLPIFKRHSWMFSHYFIEGESEKDQIYLHAPAGYHKFIIDSSTGKGGLQAVNICQTSSKFTVAYLIQMIRSMIDPIFEDEDFNIISGDLLKTYEGDVFTLTEIPDLATVTLSYSPEVLLQFKNAKYKYIPSAGSQDPYSWAVGFFNYYQGSSHHLTMVGNTPSGKPALHGYMSLDAANDNHHTDGLLNTLNQNCLGADMYEWSRDTLLTTPSKDVQPVENMINSRLTLGFTFMPDSQITTVGYNYDQLFFGSEWPVFYRIYTYHRNKTTGNITLFSRTYDHSLVIDLAFANSLNSSQLPVRSAFKYLPELALITVEFDQSGQYAVDVPGRSMFEVDNYAYVSSLVIQGLHNAAILGEYNIPNLSIGK